MKFSNILFIVAAFAAGVFFGPQVKEMIPFLKSKPSEPAQAAAEQ